VNYSFKFLLPIIDAATVNNVILLIQLLNILILLIKKKQKQDVTTCYVSPAVFTVWVNKLIFKNLHF